MTPILALTAMIAMALVVFRAYTQAITIDEASTYLLFVGADEPFHWLGSTNNHVLNTALMRLTMRLFGVSEFSARLPAMLGAALYISACYRFCQRLDGGAILRWAALVCLVYSPFIMDYLVAARGYSLALGFLMTALIADPKKLAGCVLASTAIGLCLAANFSFAFACAAVLAGLFVWSWRESEIPRGKLFAAYLLPPMLTTWVIAAPSMVNFPRGELWYGSHSLREALASLLESQLAHHSAWFYLAPGLITLLWLVHIRNLLPPMTILFGGAFLATTLLHFAAFHTVGLLYPLDRTGIFLVPLLFGAIAAAATIPGGWLRQGQIAALLLVAVANLALLRLDRFEEWNFNLDSDNIYSIVQCVHARHGANHVAAGWPFIGTMNFYRRTVTDPVPEIIDESKAGPETELYALDFRLTPTVVENRKLEVVWRSKVSEAIIAASPGQAARLQGTACF